MTMFTEWGNGNETKIWMQNADNNFFPLLSNLKSLFKLFNTIQIKSPKFALPMDLKDGIYTYIRNIFFK